jgi:hypothetical protein
MVDERQLLDSLRVLASRQGQRIEVLFEDPPSWYLEGIER